METSREVYFKSEEEAKTIYAKLGISNLTTKRLPRTFFYKVNGHWHICCVVGYIDGQPDMVIIEFMNFEKKIVWIHEFIKMQEDKAKEFAQFEREALRQREK
ncbi:hypothetical protein ACSVDA_02355 [Cytobacillus sp. Hm23]